MPVALKRPVTKRSPDQKRLSRDELITSHMALVRHALERIAATLPRHVDREDLLEAGMVGLIDAAGRFDRKRNVRFSTYAMPRIRGAIFDALRNEDRLPRSLRDEVDALNEARNELEHALHRRPTEEELCARLGVEPGKLAKLNRAVRTSTFLSLESMRDDPDGPAFGPVYPARGTSDAPPDRAALEEDKTRLADAIAQLPEKERLVISLYYFEQMLLRDIAEVLNVSDSRVCQIHRGALGLLQSMMSEPAAALADTC